jgi:hypothetical protein
MNPMHKDHLKLKEYIMQQLKYYATIIFIFVLKASFAQMATAVKPFDKVIISPHIEVTFIQGNEETVTIENCAVDKEKINIEVNGKTLRIYLEGAKEITKNKKVYDNGYKEKRPIYRGTVVTAIVTYKTIESLSVRGDETHVCKSLLTGDKFRLKVYGDAHVILNDVNLGELQTTLYGESVLDIKSGRIGHQKYTAYGESKINSMNVASNITRITAYGEADFTVNTSDEIKITAFGEAKIKYRGDAVINKGIHIGEMRVEKID